MSIQSSEQARVGKTDAVEEPVCIEGLGMGRGVDTSWALQGSFLKFPGLTLLLHTLGQEMVIGMSFLTLSRSTGPEFKLSGKSKF